MAKRLEVDIDGRRLSLSNLDKVFYPETGFTKGQMIDYYTRVAPALLDHLRGRPLTLKRYPNGVTGAHFYEKQCPGHRPDWVVTSAVWSRHNSRTIDFCLAEDLPTLVWLANLADLELHTSLARAPKVDRPTMMVFDLDPGEGANIVNCSQVAFWLREKLSAMKLESFAKTSGSKGLQLYVPLNTPVTFEQTKALARQLGDTLVVEHPNAVVTKMLKILRQKKVLIDWSQNDAYKTTICVYSLRATPKPQVSTPLSWAELEKLWKRGDPDAYKFSPDAVLARVKKHGDLFEPVLTLKQKLPK